MDIIIRKASLADVKSIVNIHQAAFKDFFLTSLGERFLVLYYSSFINSDKGVVFCAVRGSAIVGFSAASYVCKGFNFSLIKHNLFKYGAEGFRLMFSNPKAVVRLAKNMSKASENNSINDDGMYAELYSIAIAPDLQGCGVGRLLLTATETDVKKNNNRISLTTDSYHNEKTLAFYNALGYKKYYEFNTFPNRKMWRLMKDLI